MAAARDLPPGAAARWRYCMARAKAHREDFEDGDPESRRCARLPSQRSAMVAHVPEDAATEARPENPREYQTLPRALLPLLSRSEDRSRRKRRHEDAQRVLLTRYSTHLRRFLRLPLQRRVV